MESLSRCTCWWLRTGGNYVLFSKRLWNCLGDVISVFKVDPNTCVTYGLRENLCWSIWLIFEQTLVCGWNRLLFSLDRTDIYKFCFCWIHHYHFAENLHLQWFALDIGSDNQGHFSAKKVTIQSKGPARRHMLVVHRRISSNRLEKKMTS